MELPTIEQPNLQASPSEIEELIERFELWCSIRKSGTQNQSALFLTAGRRDLYSLLRNLAFPEAPAKLPYESLKSLLLNHLLLTEFQADERAKFNSMTPKQTVSRCNYGDRLEEQMSDRLVAGIKGLTLQRKLLKKKDLTFADARKICEQHDDLMKTTSSESVTLFQRQKTRPNRPPMAKCVPKPQHESSGNEEHINPCLSCGAYHLRCNFRFRNAKCHVCGKTGHIRRVCKQPFSNLTQPTAGNDTNDLSDR
ncbi:unnamed protein product [Echinostoma caproni]|uniref:CCHC-type domain-containing protein n=1 Tax=Echinostoma caproni TaxID=27848 RepID=A0A183B7Y2_9TREM|nr:unnamed protein product [Echinostoma caproni]